MGEGLGATYTAHWIARSGFLFMLHELFALGVTTETVGANIK